MATEIVDQVSRKSTGTSRTSQAMTRLWRAMGHLFGTRWAENYGREPSPIWAAEIDKLTDEQIGIACQRLLKSGAAHPPTLPEFLEHARRPTGVANTYIAPPDCAQFELAVNNWFVTRAVQGRFNGIDNAEGELRIGFAAGKPRQTLDAIRDRAMEVSRQHSMLSADGDPAATNARLVQLLDAIAEEFYPIAMAELWRDAHPIVSDPKWNQDYSAPMKMPSEMTESEYPF